MLAYSLRIASAGTIDRCTSQLTHTAVDTARLPSGPASPTVSPISCICITPCMPTPHPIQPRLQTVTVTGVVFPGIAVVGIEAGLRQRGIPMMPISICVCPVYPNNVVPLKSPSGIVANATSESLSHTLQIWSHVSYVLITEVCPAGI